MILLLLWSSSLSAAYLTDFKVGDIIRRTGVTYWNGRICGSLFCEPVIYRGVNGRVVYLEWITGKHTGSIAQVPYVVYADDKWEKVTIIGTVYLITENKL